jgi:hypothetical protein
MRRILASLAIAVLTAAPAAASEENDVMAVVRQWTGILNRDDSKLALATCADETAIIDDFPPYVWLGSGACSKWLNDLNAYSVKSAMTDMSSTLLKPWHVQVTADRAYVAVPINYTLKVEGKDVKETGSVLTVSLQRVLARWRITALAIAAR